MTPHTLGMSGRALTYWMRRQEATAHNLANVETPGFRAERVFARIGARGEPVAHSGTVDRAGPLTQTGNPLGVAIGPSVFLVVETGTGERYVRGGPLRLGEDGTLLDAAGHPLLGGRGPIVLPPGPVQIDADGTIRVAGDEIDRLRMELSPAGDVLERDAAGLYAPPAQRLDAPASERQVRQGWLEGSNVGALESMIEMLAVQRSFGAVQNSIRMLDGVLDRIANDIGRVG